MRENQPILKTDYAQQWLIPYLADTERLLKDAVGEKYSDKVQIEVAADLCIPHDVIRLLGGFATGMYVRWDSDEPFVPVDICMNTDVISIFGLESLPEGVFTKDNFESVKNWVNSKTSYIWNFDNGNHFISLTQSQTGEYSLLMHSNEKEFKYQGNGLVPTPDNWYFDDIQEVRRGDRYLRYLKGEKARTFYELAKSLEDYSINRHRIIATRLLGNKTAVYGEYHKVHYYMPSQNEAVLGCYVCEPQETVPILSYSGGPIFLFRTEAGGENVITLADGKQALLMTHGYGKASSEPISLKVESGRLYLNGVDYPIEPQAGLSGHKGFSIRDFHDDPNHPNSLLSVTKLHTPGEVTDILDQLAWYSSTGFSTKT